MIDLPKPFFVLAPMDDVTDVVFRSVVAECAAPDLFFTEFVNVDGLQSPGQPKLMPKLAKGENDRPIIAQVWGLKPENYEKTAAELVEMGFDGIDINMGCPIKNVVNNGACSALINNRELAGEIIAATKRGAAGRVPVSVKTRLGFNTVDLSWIEFLLGQEIDMLTIHFRTRKEMSKVPAQWEYARQIVELRDRLAPKVLLVGNGDVPDRSHGEELAAQSGLDGIMIGRGVFADPYCFAIESPWDGMGRAERLALFKKHVELFAATWQHGERNHYMLNRFCKIYVNGFDGAKELRERMMLADGTTELLAQLDEVLQSPVAA